jgi:hypothetical protein
MQRAEKERVVLLAEIDRLKKVERQERKNSKFWKER